MSGSHTRVYRQPNKPQEPSRRCMLGRRSAPRPAVKCSSVASGAWSAARLSGKVVSRTRTAVRKFDHICRFGYSAVMSVNVKIPEDLAEQIDRLAADRNAFVERAVRKVLDERLVPAADEIARINENADQLNREAGEVLEFQVIP